MREAAENALNHLVRSLITKEGTAGALLGEDAGPWCALLERVSRQFGAGTAYTARALLSVLTERVSELTSSQLVDVGAAARRLLEFAWSRTPRDRWLVIHAIQYVCRTFGSDPAGSTAFLRHVIEPLHLRKHGSEELPWLAEEVEALLVHDPELVRDIYVATFGYRETSNEPSPMGGIVMPLISNRRQDYDGALYHLERAFPAFLRSAPELAIEALNSALEAHVARERLPLERQAETAFDFGGTEAWVREDYSHIWDRGSAYPDEQAVELLDHMQAYLNDLAESEDAREEIGRVLSHVVKTARLAAVWRRLLDLGTRHPVTIGLQLRPLAWAPPILLGAETGRAAGEFIRAVAPHLNSSDREQLERGVLALPDTADPAEQDEAEHARDRILGCLGEMGVVTEDARARLNDLRSRDAVPANEDDTPWFGVSSRAYTEEDHLAEQGVPVQEESNRRVRELEVSVKEFTKAYANQQPDEESIAAIIPRLRTLHEALGSAHTEGVHPKQADHAWGILAGGFATVARWAKLSCSEGAGALSRDVLLEASEHPVPRHDPASDSSFDEFQSWGSPSARIDATEGLMSLASKPECADTRVLRTIERLAGDAVPAVRFQVGIRLSGLLRSAPDTFWSLMERFASVEQSRGVLGGVMKWPLYALRFREPERVAELALEIYNRVTDGPGAKDVRNACVDILVDLHLWGEPGRATDAVLEIADNVFENLEQASHMAPRFREILVSGPTDGSDPAADAARGRAFELLHCLTISAKGLFQEVTGSSTPPGVQDGARRLSEEQLRVLAHLLDSVAFDLYLVSGAHSKEETEPPTADVQARLLTEAGPLIDELADIGLPSLTHHLLEMLAVLVPVDPYGVFMRIAAVILGGKKGGYQYDSMAERVLVRVVERYFADFRAVFQRSDEIRNALIAILDTFVEAGSIGARRLSYGLEGIFR